ncbi:hypothetical protein [Paenibacillus riograndensis]|uniref:Uncharacterized protein n=1 Tax=Paenibacillus riograndensis SBR5 TaxID=1073571 RepID=A0A0E4CYZ7_9BACL|nr:hypothetical protein [Paenibacillus riograndensis]CQR57982.1 hypothetical protein PRIO_5595 [Paenibacillus riograndensis SBR5]
MDTYGANASAFVCGFPPRTAVTIKKSADGRRPEVPNIPRSPDEVPYGNILSSLYIVGKMRGKNTSDPVVNGLFGKMRGKNTSDLVVNGLIGIMRGKNTFDPVVNGLVGEMRGKNTSDHPAAPQQR